MTATKQDCLYGFLKPNLLPCKIFGLFPVTCNHTSNQCNVKISKLWLIHSLLCIGISTFITLHCTLVLASQTKANAKLMHEIISNITDVTHGTFTVLLILLSIARGRKFANAINKLSTIMHRELLCQDTLDLFRKVQRINLIILFTVIALEYAAIVFTVKTFIAGLVRISTFLVYILTSSVSFFFTSIFTCFERVLSITLAFTPVHPLNFDQVQFRVCQGNHRRLACEGEILEHLRRLHENICLVFYEVNEALSPMHLLLMLVEITTLVLHWYVVILYIIGDYAYDITIFNCLYVATHSLGLLQYLRNCQILHNKVNDLKNYLLQFSTRTTDVSVQLQVRLFLEKLNQYKPTNACGIFDIDLGIAAPICANILTYVLVALQFEVTK